MRALVEEAKGAMQRLHAGAMKLLGRARVSQASDKDAFKPHILTIKSWMDKDDHLLTWSELQGGETLTMASWKAFMAEQADSAVKLNEECEKFKALWKARKEL